MVFDRDGHWLGKLKELVSKSPGITFPKLVQRCPNLTQPELEGYLQRLIDQGKIRSTWITARGGKVVSAFHACAPSLDEPTEQLWDMLRRAETHFLTGMDCLRTAKQMAEDLANPPPAAIVEPRPDGYQTATVPAGEAALAG